jgi:hypothetical protein
MQNFSNLFYKVLYIFWKVPLSTIRSTSKLYTCNKVELFSILTTLAEANKTSMTDTYCVYTVLRCS